MTQISFFSRCYCLLLIITQCSCLVYSLCSFETVVVSINFQPTIFSAKMKYNRSCRYRNFTEFHRNFTVISPNFHSFRIDSVIPWFGLSTKNWFPIFLSNTAVDVIAIALASGGLYILIMYAGNYIVIIIIDVIVVIILIVVTAVNIYSVLWSISA